MAAEERPDRIASDMGVCMKHRGELNSSIWKQWHPLTCLLNTDGYQKVGVSTVTSGWCFSAVAIKLWKKSHVPDSHKHVYKCDLHALVHCCWKYITNGGHYVEKPCFVAENSLYQIILLCSLLLLSFPRRRHHFQSDLYIYYSTLD